jgi:hypothetical protein
MSRVQCPPTVDQTAAGKLGAEFFRWATRLDVAIAIRKSNDLVGIRHIKKSRFRSGRIERDPEGIIHAVISEDLGRRRRVSAAVTQDLDAVRAAFGDENVAIRRREEEAWIDEAARVFLYLEAGGYVKLGAGWPPDDPWIVVRRFCRVRRWQIIDGNLVPRAGRILSPVIRIGFRRYWPAHPRNQKCNEKRRRQAQTPNWSHINRYTALAVRTRCVRVQSAAWNRQR